MQKCTKGGMYEKEERKQASCAGSRFCYDSWYAGRLRKHSIHNNRQGCCFIDWNTGENSPLDMFLMSQCKYAIIANSTFSYWGAMLGRKKELVYYPTKWINSEFGNPHIFPEDWKTY